MAQSYYTIPTSAVYRSPDGKKNFWFYADDQIPMELAVEMGMSGAALPDPDPYFDASEQAAIVQLASENVSGTPTQLPAHDGRIYDNRTAGAGVEASYTIYPMTLVGGLIRVEESAKQATRLGIRVTTPGGAGSTARLSLYGLNQSTDQYEGFGGTRLHDAGTVAVTTTGYKSINIFAAGITVDPGLYWVFVEPSEQITIAGFQSHAGHLGLNTASGVVYSGLTYNVGTGMATHPASMNGGSVAQLAPLVMFELYDV